MTFFLRKNVIIFFSPVYGRIRFFDENGARYSISRCILTTFAITIFKQMKAVIRFILALLFLVPVMAHAQQKGIVKGRVFDSKNNEPVPFANVVIWKTTIGTAADENGYFRIENVPLGFNRLEVSSVGYNTKLSEEFMVNTASERTVNVELEESSVSLEQVTVKADPFRKTAVSKSVFRQWRRITG